jgi:site-specific DNA-methyltransferase (adenine-specific)
LTKTKQYASRNKTIRLNEHEIESYAKLCQYSNNLTYPNDVINNIIYGDAFDVLSKLPVGFVDLLIVDPPYNLNKKYSSNMFKRMDCDEYILFTRRWLEAVKNTLKTTASIYICSDWQTSMIIGNIIGEYFTIQNRITWQREKGRGALRNWKNSMEDIWFATVSPNDFTFNVDAVKMRRQVIAPYRVNGSPKDWTENKDGNFRDTCPSNFWDDISVPYWSMAENTDHPTQKPEKLFAKLILASSNPDDIVLDPFVGSGTSSVVAKKLGRRYIGIEREIEYCAYAKKRLEMADLNIAIQGYTDGIFWERNTLAQQLRVCQKTITKKTPPNLQTAPYILLQDFHA